MIGLMGVVRWFAADPACRYRLSWLFIAAKASAAFNGIEMLGAEISDSRGLIRIALD